MIQDRFSLHTEKEFWSDTYATKPAYSPVYSNELLIRHDVVYTNMDFLDCVISC
jgi:hypothetical protein